MQKTFAILALWGICGAANAQTVQSNSATATFSGLEAAGATVTIQPNTGGTYQLIGSGRNTFALHANVAPRKPMRSTLKLYRGQVLVRDIPGPSPIDYEFVEEMVLRKEFTDTGVEEEWVWPAIMVGMFLANCVTYSETTTTNSEGQSQTTSSFGWDCGGNGMVTVDGNNYDGITSVTLETVASGQLAQPSALTFSASGGGRIISVR
jgi:hypothetical protein